MIATNYSYGIERDEEKLKENSHDHTKWSNPLEVQYVQYRSSVSQSLIGPPGFRTPRRRRFSAFMVTERTPRCVSPLVATLHQKLMRREAFILVHSRRVRVRRRPSRRRACCLRERNKLSHSPRAIGHASHAKEHDRRGIHRQHSESKGFERRENG